MKTCVWLAIPLFLWCSAARAQFAPGAVPPNDWTGTGSITAQCTTPSSCGADTTVPAVTNGTSEVNFNVTGTFVGTVQIEGEDLSGNWISIAGAVPSTGALESSFTVPTFITVPSGGWLFIRLRCSAYTSGTISVSWDASLGSNFVRAFSTNYASFQAIVELTNGTNIAYVGNDGELPDAYMLKVNAGKGFSVTSNGLTSGAASEVAYLYLKNASGNTKTVKLKNVILSPTSGSGNTVYKFYMDPTITANGTSLTIDGNRQSSQNSAQATAFRLPTASANGTVFKSVNMSSGSAFVVPFDLSRYIEAGHSLLITSTQSLLGGSTGVDIEWVEE